ncbi:MAG: FAD-dependent oxidoreductase [Planctomycetia bacterium]|nr:FAD-dependent oxidoreductase [Planctomycetia bacterium]
MQQHTGLSRREFLATCAATCAAFSGQHAHAADQVVEADLCIYGGTSGGVAAAVQAARMGKRVVLIEPGKHLGGMTSGGLSAVDIGDPRTVGGIAREYFTRLAAKFGRKLAFDQPLKGVPTGGAFAIEPHTAEQVFDELIRNADVPVLRGEPLKAVKKVGARIVELVTQSGAVFRAKMFIDATYEGDLMAQAGVSCTVNREANSKYNETLNGIQLWEKPEVDWGKPGPNGRRPDGRGVWDRAIPLDPYVKPGNASSGLLPGVQAGDLGKIGEAAPGVQAYCYRLCLTTRPANRLPIERPAGYDAARYELHARYIAACLKAGDAVDLRWFSKFDPLPNDKFDFNTAYLGLNLPGASHAYAEANPERRAEIVKDHENYARGLLHFLATDGRVPEKLRQQTSQFGLCKDEFPDHGGWPHQLYVREARRMVSDLVMTEHHCRGTQVAPHSVALASYGIDIHEVRRIAHQGIVVREGKLLGHHGLKGPYPVGYGAIMPKAAECENLFVTFALSASHVAFGSIRMEPVFMALSQSAATAGCLAIDERVSVQKVSQEKLRERLLKDAQILEPRKG